jgi:hypothetical protein
MRCSPVLLSCLLLSALAVFRLSALPSVSALMTKDQANTPNDYTPLNPQNLDYTCLLSALSFSNGLTLLPAFQSNIFHYGCSCAFAQSLFQTVAHVTTLDPGSVVEVSLNGVDLNFRSSNNAVSNLGNVLQAPLVAASSPLLFKAGQNSMTLGVTCNANCYYQYNISCYQPPETFVVGDPQFVGLRGQQYQVHGVAGEIYNIVSDKNLQYNSRFVFLNEGDCPVVAGHRQKGCWSHPGSYLGELGLKTKAGDRIRLASGRAADGFKAVTVNEKQISVGDTLLLADDMGSVAYNSTHSATVTVGHWQFTFENSDMFINQRVRVADARALRSHGLLGQTWREQTYNNAVKHVQGAVDDYVIRDGDLFGDNFVYNTFN